MLCVFEFPHAFGEFSTVSLVACVVCLESCDSKVDVMFYIMVGRECSLVDDQ